MTGTTSAGGRVATTVIGSYPQPGWLIDGDALTSNLPPLVRLEQLWRVPPELLEQAQDDATIVAIHDMERAGIDIVTDGEARRESYFNRFATALEGIDLENPGQVPDRSGNLRSTPRIVGPVRRARPVQKRDAEFAKSHSSQPVCVTVPGPFTMAQQSQNDYYDDDAALALDLAAAVNEELRDLKEAGADLVQLDEPYLEPCPKAAREYGFAAIDKALAGIDGTKRVHSCFGYAYVVGPNKPGRYELLRELNECAADQIALEAAQPNLDLSTLRAITDKTVVLGVLNLGNPEAETPEEVAGRIRNALEHVPADRLIAAPDCGMKYLPRDIAYAKLVALAQGAALVE